MKLHMLLEFLPWLCSKRPSDQIPLLHMSSTKAGVYNDYATPGVAYMSLHVMLSSEGTGL